MNLPASSHGLPLAINTAKLYRGMQLATEALLQARLNWAEDKIGEFSFHLQLGRGRRTYLRHGQKPLKPGSGLLRRALLKRPTPVHEFKLVYGRRCIEEMFEAEHYHHWKSFAELQNNTAHNREAAESREPLTPLHHLSHIVLHEFSHFVQSILGQRYRGSVHNPEFYHILADSYAANSDQLVMAHILNACVGCPETTQALHTGYGSRRLPLPVAARSTNKNQLGFQRGQNVSFVYRNKRYTGTITRLNKQRASVACENTEFPRALIPYTQLEELESE